MMHDSIVRGMKDVFVERQRHLFHSLAIHSLNLSSTRFAGGTLYEISADTKFLELSYDVTAVAEGSFEEYRGLGTINSFRLASGALAGLSGALLPFPPKLDEPPEPRRIITKQFALFAKARVFVRLIDQILDEVELHGLEISHVEEVAKVAEVSSTADDEESGQTR